LTEVRDNHKFEYADERCIELAKKIKLLIDDTAVYADWLNNTNLRNKLASQLTVLIYKEGYPPEWDEEVFKKVLDQVENYKKNGTSKLKFTKLANVEDDRDVRNLIFNRLQMDANISDMELQREVTELYGTRYPDMGLNDWRHIIEAYTPMVRTTIQSKVKEIDLQYYSIAAEPEP
jgi:type I restriction enzyme R subunit